MTITLELLNNINNFTINVTASYNTIAGRSLERIYDFINDRRVQDTIRDDYDDKKYYLFDTSFGDNGCQSRPLNLLPIILKNPSYNELPEKDRLYLSLCHILKKYKVFELDAFGMATLDKIQPSKIGYGPNSNRKILKYAEDTAVVMCHLLANMSVQGVREAAENRGMLDRVSTDKTKNAPDQKSFFRKEPTSSELDLLLSYMLENNIPLMLKMTRINAEDRFTLQGADIIMYLPENGRFRPATNDEVLNLSTSKAVLAECFSIASDEKQRSMFDMQRQLDGAPTFEEYVAVLKTMDIRDLMLPLAYVSDLELNMINQAPEYQAEVAVLSGQKLDYLYTKPPVNIGGRLLPSKYMDRNSTNVPFNIAHFYVSTLAQEQESLNTIKRDASLEPQLLCKFSNEKGRGL